MISFWISVGGLLFAEDINAELEAAGLARLGSWQTIARALKQLDD